MVVVKVMGGLASQMHKYAVGRTLADQKNCDLLLDLSWFEKKNSGDTKREFMLNKYNLRFNTASKKILHKLKASFLRRKLSSLLKLFDLSTNFLEISSHYIDGTSSYNILNCRPPIYIEGEWFGDELIKSNRKKILLDFQLVDPLSSYASETLSKIIKSESISIHVRRGDYVSNKSASSYHVLTGIDYYKKAVEHLSSLVDNPVFFVFSDDMLWVKNNFIDIKGNFIFVEKNEPHEDLFLISQCRHNVIANSSFSWIGAWINDQVDKKMIAPSHWVYNKNNNQLICEDLTRSGFELICNE